MSETPIAFDQLAAADSATQIDSSKFPESEVFAAALEFGDALARKDFLDRIAGVNSHERARLDRLLAYSATEVDFLEPSVVTVRAEPSRIESVGDWLGPYRLLRQIGEGGMGTVYLAEQITPLQRSVAIKVIKPGMDSSQVLARFDAERQTLAMMEHPNIARALDVGVSAYERTYFVMELVSGVPITRYCDELGLSIRQRLELFIQVCLAIQHAHHKGIIHRDLKPSNILVAEYDGVPVPKVIDFGVSKAIHQQFSRKSLFTRLGQIVGTIEYMSPEQSRGHQLDIDTRSDIYSLGVLLYELVTGSTPIESDELKELGWDELSRKIREEDAPAPSQRLQASQQIQTVARTRDAEPNKLSATVKGELDWIILKALDKQRTRRYQNTTELVEDIQRFLQGREVLACPPSTSYKIRKYLQKHRIALLSGGLVAAALILGLSGTTWQAWNASIARQQAERQRDIANEETRRAQEAQARAQLEAERSAKEAAITQAVANFVNNDLIAFADPNLEPDRDIRLRQIVDRASEKVASLQAAPLVEASIRYTLAKSYLGLGEYRLALKHANSSWENRTSQLSESHPESLASLMLVAEAHLKLSRYREAVELFAQAVELCQASLPESALLTQDCLHGYGVALAALGKLDQALLALQSVAEARARVLGDHHEQTLDTEREIAKVLFQKGEYLEASKAFDAAIAKMNLHLGESHPLTLKTVAEASEVDSELGEINASRSKREQILHLQKRVLGELHPDTLLTESSLTLVDTPTLKSQAAIAKNLELMKIAGDRFGVDHSVTLQITLALAELLMEHGRSNEAREHLQRCKTTLQTLHQGASPELLRVHSHIAGCLAFEGRYTTALALYRDTLENQRTLLSPKHLDALKTQLAYAYLLMTTGGYGEAEQQLQNLIATATDSDLRNHPLLQFAQSQLATLECVLGREAGIERHQLARAAAHEKYGALSTISLQLDIALVESLLRIGKRAEAKKILQDGLAIVELHYDNEHPIHGQLQDSLIESLAGDGEFDIALERARQLHLQRTAAFGNKHPLTLRSLNQEGALLVQSGRAQQGEKLIREAMTKSRESFGKEFPLTLTCQQNLASTLGVLSISNRTLRNEALDLYEDLLAIQSAWGVDHPDWLFSQLGYAGALGHQARFMQAERVFQMLLPKLIKTFGESHPVTLRCRENYSSVLGSLEKHAEAIEQCRYVIRLTPISSPTWRKVTHAAIEYYINSSDVLSASDLFESAFETASQPNAELEWLFLDIPFFVEAIIDSGDHAKATQLLDQSVGLFAEKLGGQHPTTRFLKAKLLSLYAQHKQADKFEPLFQQMLQDAEVAGEMAAGSCVDVIAGLAESWKSGNPLLSASLYGLAKSNQPTPATPDGDSPFTSADVDDNPQQADTVDYGLHSIEALQAAVRRGQFRSLRSQHWLKESSDFSGLHERDDFKQLIADMEQSAAVEKQMRLAWNFGVVGEHQAAAEILRKFAIDQPVFANLGVTRYLMARAWARCYEAAMHEESTELATDYLAECEECLTKCKLAGYFSGPEERSSLATDDNFEIIRNRIQDFGSYSAP